MGGCFRRLSLFGLEIVLVLGFMTTVNTDMQWNDKWNLNPFTRSSQTPYSVKSWNLAMLFLSWTWSNHGNDRCLFLWKGRKVVGQKPSVFSWTTPMSCAAVSRDLNRLHCLVTLIFLPGVRRSYGKRFLLISLSGSPLPINQPNTFHFPYSQLLKWFLSFKS